MLHSEMVDMKVALVQEIKEQFQNGLLPRADEEAIRNYVNERCTNYWYHLETRDDVKAEIVQFVL